MAITLKTDAATNYLRYNGGEVVELVEGQQLKIETSPMGEELLVATVPAGKTWSVGVSVNIEEHNA